MKERPFPDTLRRAWETCTQGPCGRKWAGRILFFVGVTFLTVEFMYNPFRLGIPGQFEAFESNDNQLIVTSMQQFATLGLSESSGLLHKPDKTIYTSRSGFAALLPYGLLRLSGLPPYRFMVRYYYATAMLLAVGLMLFVFSVARHFGRLPALVLFALLALSNWIVFVASNIGYLYHLYFWPFLAAWLLYPRCLAGVLKERRLLLLVALLAFLKSLAGYEYITNVLLAPTVAPVYFGLLHKESCRRIIGRVVRMVAVGLIAFALALFVNVAQAACYFKSAEKGARAIVGKAMARTWGPDSTLDDLEQYGNDASPPGFPLEVQVDYLLSQPAIGWPTEIYQERMYRTFFAFFLLALPLGMLPLLDGRRFPLVQEHQRKLTAMAVTLFWSAACTMSWPLLAKGYMYHHQHVAPICLSVTYMLIVYVAIGMALSLGARQAVNWVHMLWGRNTRNTS
ncbi:MAG: hypothetical protein V1929_01490 [bacterium]